MRKILISLFVILVMCGCKNEEEYTKEPIISSKGELKCAYRKQNTNENTIYTSYYIYEFNNYGILKSVFNHEEVEFNNSKEEVKEQYKESIKDIIKEYKDIKGVSVTDKYEKDKYYFEVNIDKEKADEETKEKFLLNEDRISLYKIYNSNQYNCE